MKTSELSRKSEETVTATRRPTKKSAVSQTASSAEAANQREEAIQWASEAASGTDVAKLGASTKGTTRPKPSKKTATGDARAVIDALADSLAVQEFIAMQYPPVEEVVSSPMRMGRALVSGALGMRTDDPKLFATAVRLPECTVVLQSTKSKAKVPVSAPPPNSFDSEVEINDVEDVQLSQSTTDIGVHIELPDGEIELTPQRIVDDGCNGSARDMSMMDAPVVPGIVSTPMMTQIDFEVTKKVGENAGEINRVEKDSSNEKVACAPCDKGITESQGIMNKIDGAKLLHEELVRREPSLTSISTFLNTVCGGTAREKKSEKTEEANVQILGDKEMSVILRIKTRSEAKYLEKQRVTRILVAKTLLEEELANDEPSLFLIAVFRKAAYGGDVSEGKETVCDVVGTEETVATRQPFLSLPNLLQLHHLRI